jgi:hypothetical protein
MNSFLVPRVSLAPQPLEALPETPPRVLVGHRLQRRDHLGISLKRCPRFPVVRRPREPRDFGDRHSASASFRIATIYDSVNRDFFIGTSQ